MNLIRFGQGNSHRMRLRHAVLYNLIALLWLTGPFTAGSDSARKIGAWLETPATVAQADAIVVLGGAANERLPVAIELFQDGFAPALWYTGAVEDSQAGDGTSAQLAAKHAHEMGIPAEAITLLATTSTWEDGQQIAATAQARGVRSILVVTSWYHGRRALCAIHHHIHDDAIRVYYQPVETREFGPDNWWLTAAGQRIVTTELYKDLFYWAYYGLVPWLC